MDSTKYGNALEFDIDLHSIYAAYLGQFEAAGLDWWDKSWGGYFATFNDFLGFGWEVMVVVDGRTGRSHIAVRREQIALFAKMIRTRFGESLAKDPPTTLPLSPVPTRTLSLRRLVTLTDLAAYRKLSLTLSAAELSHLRYRARSGDVDVAEQLFYAGGSSTERERGSGAVGMRDNGVGYTFACVKTTWWDKGGSPGGLIPGSGRTQGRTGPGAQGKGLILEVGIAVVRCANLRAVDVWPPTPAENYRKSHFITEEWVDKRTNQNPPTYPRAYAFGKSQYIADKDVERILDANLAALASQENDSNANTLILLTLGEPNPLPVPASSTLPNNILHIDILALEFNLLRRAQEQGVPGTPDRHSPLTSLSSLLQTLQIPIPPFAPLGNAGNEAYYTLLAFQKLMMAQTRLPDVLFKADNMAFGYGFPQSNSMVFPPYSPLAPPHAPFHPPHIRQDSNTSKRQSEMFNPPIRTKSPHSRRSSHHIQPENRPRPASFNDTGGSGQYKPDRRMNGYSTPPSHEDLPASAPSTVRVPGRGPMTRSSTIFWDDAEYADAEVSSPKRQEASMRDQHRLRPTQTQGDGSTQARQRNPPPSAMRYNSSGQIHTLNSTGSSRTVSWSEEGHRKTSTDSRPVAPRDRSSDRRSNLNAFGSSTTLDSPTSASPSKGRPMSLANGSQGMLSPRAAPGSGSTTVLGSHSGSEGRESKIVPLDSGKKVQESGEKEKNKEKGGKMKSEKSMRNVAGALARFWVG